MIIMTIFKEISDTDEFEINTINSSKISMLIFLINPNNSFIELYNGSIQIQYNDINYQIKKNTVDVSNNLINTNINEDNIAINKGDIDHLKKT